MSRFRFTIDLLRGLMHMGQTNCNLRAWQHAWAWTLGVYLLAGGALLAQEEAEATTTASPAATSSQPADAKAAAAKAGAAKGEGQKTGEAKPADGKPADASKKDKAEAKSGEAKPGEGKKEEKSGSIKRPTEPKTPPDPAELKVRPDEDGLISFSFKNQPWPEVLEWLADIMNLSLHWEEAPSGYLDLTTRGKYTPEEVRDLLNSVLLQKGFTVLRNGEILIVANLKTLDSSLVPRVTPEELDERGTYELVKTFFDLNSLLADAMVEEIKPMLSPYGKVSALKTTNRIDVLETAGNLRRIRELLKDEQSDRTQERLVRQFKLQFTRASEVLETLNTLLGIKSTKSSNQNLTPQQQMMQQQQAMMLAQQQAQQGKAPPPSKQEPQIFLAINSRENTILANAPPDKMAIVEQAVAVIDVPVDRSQSLLTNMSGLRIYRLSGVDPETIVKVLQDVGGLDPSTRLEVDEKNRAIIARAPVVDHVMIQTLVDRLDGTGRKFEVIQLRLLRAENVAGSIEMLMKGPPENNTQRRSPFYFDYGYGRGSDSTEKTDKFQVDADIEHNRLLLRANDAELAEVRELLVKLGEIPSNGRNENRVRTLPALPEEETKALLERLKRIWPSMGGNPLEIDAPPSSSRRSPNERPTDQPPTIQPPAIQPSTLPPRETTRSEPTDSAPKGPVARTTGIKLLELALQQPNEQAVDDGSGAPVEQRPVEQRPGPPTVRRNDQPAQLDSAPRGVGPEAAIHITVGPQGLILSSSDTAALDELEDLINNLAPQRLSYKIFTLHHTYAKDVALLLEDVYKEGDDKKKGDTDFWERFYFGYSGGNQKQTPRSSLSKRRPLAFVPDPVTNTILVQGADDAQLAEIEELISVYDRIEPADSNAVRRQQMVTLKYSNARQVADVVKDVYRDLLSPNDKALANPNQQQQKQEQQGYFPSIYSYLAGANKDDGEKNIPRFKGMLSVGIDPLSNSVVVSAPQALLVEVVAMVEDLDMASQPLRPVTQVFRVNQPGAAEVLRDALSPGGRGSSTRGKASSSTGAADNRQKPNGNNNGNGGRNGNQRNGGRQNGNGAANSNN
jgi:type II secretory pathway component GspD/PulD (secretin)